jgi:hypothetical protein
MCTNSETSCVGAAIPTRLGLGRWGGDKRLIRRGGTQVPIGSQRRIHVKKAKSQRCPLTRQIQGK